MIMELNQTYKLHELSDVHCPICLSQMAAPMDHKAFARKSTYAWDCYNSSCGYRGNIRIDNDTITLTSVFYRVHNLNYPIRLSEIHPPCNSINEFSNYIQKVLLLQ